MAAVGPPISPDKGKERPLVCLGNAHGKSCPPEMTEQRVNCFREAFSLNENEISINKPFAGGYITREYGEQSVPWIQVELNQSLYLQEPNFSRENFIKDEDRIIEIRQKFEEALQLFFNMKYVLE